jgi:hypothetical protein
MKNILAKVGKYMIYITLGIVVILIIITWALPLQTNEKSVITTAISTVALALYTAIYAWFTRKMATQMEKQKTQSLRPYIIQKAQQKMVVKATVFTDYFSHFEIYNAGKGPAIEPEIYLLNDKKEIIFLEDKVTYIRAEEEPLKLLPIEFNKKQKLPDIMPPVILIPIHLVAERETSYLVTQYKSTFSNYKDPTWYQSCLPFISHRVKGNNEIQVVTGEQIFTEVPHKLRLKMHLLKKKTT